MSVSRFYALTFGLQLVACSLFYVPCGAQDLDFPDYRSKRDNFSKVSDKMMRADIAGFALAAVDESIGKAQLKTVPLKEYGPNFMKFEGPDDRGVGIQVTIRTGTFDPTKHKLMIVDKHLLRIDGHPYYGGNYGETPRTTIESVVVVVGKDTVPVPREAYSDLYDPKFSFTEGGASRTRNAVYLSADKNSHVFYVYMLNIENGGSEFTWVIQNKQYARRVVDFGMLPK
jgi:hypothetical protein